MQQPWNLIIQQPYQPYQPDTWARYVVYQQLPIWPFVDEKVDIPTFIFSVVATSTFTFYYLITHTSPIVKMKNQLFLIFAFFFIAALASPLEDVTNNLTKRSLASCELACLNTACACITACDANTTCELGCTSPAAKCIINCII